MVVIKVGSCAIKLIGQTDLLINFKMLITPRSRLSFVLVYDADRF